MQRTTAAFALRTEEIAIVKQKMLSWANARFSILFFADSNAYPDPYGSYECLLGAGSAQQLLSEDADAFTRLQALHDHHHDWIFFHLLYDLKNALYPRLRTAHINRYSWPGMGAVIPEVVCFIRRGESVLHVETLSGNASDMAAEIMDAPLPEAEVLPRIRFGSRFSKETYLERVAALREHIRNGDCYEITFCNEGFAEEVSVHPLSVFNRLNAASPAPFALFYKWNDQFMMSASPERFLTGRGGILRAQPIKGTARRGRNAEEDAGLIEGLCNSEKERAENVMITDLVRSDLARSCMPGSVAVDELFGIYTYPLVHQMISTISGRLRPGVPFTEAIAAAFPMGSMTGAPKHKVMQLIDRYEAAQRGLFSGSAGYISPGGDFDMNVVIRSLFYNAASGYLSYQSGGAITWGSDPEEEWAELRLKARAMEGLFGE